ncbi:MAG: hypothetical protein ACFCU4_03085 [Puniceicoccaceae bacterium]
MADTGKKKLFVEARAKELLVAVADRLDPPLTIESVVRVDAENEDAAALEIKSLAELKSGSYAFANVGIYPDGGFIRPHTVDSLGRAKAANFVDKTLSEALSIVPEDKLTAVLNPLTGALFDPSGTPSKTLLFVGGREESIRQKQRQLSGMAIFPERLELTNLAALGLAVKNLRIQNREGPELVVNFGESETQTWVISEVGIQAFRLIKKGYADLYPIVQRELGLRDTASAEHMLKTKAFDVKSIGTLLTQEMINEFLTMIGFYEVQFGQTITRLTPIGIEANFSWIGEAVASGLGMEVLGNDLADSIQSHGVTLAPSVDLGPDPLIYFNLLSLAAQASLS